MSTVPVVTHRRPANQVRVKVASNIATLMTPVSRMLAAVVMAVTDTAVDLAKAFVNRVIMPAHAVKHSGLDTTPVGPIWYTKRGYNAQRCS